MKYKYGEFSRSQISQTKIKLRKKIFFLLIIVDPKTKNDYPNINFQKKFEDILFLINGYNELLNYPQQLVDISSYLAEALRQYYDPFFDFKRYRKLILDSGSLVLEIKEV